MQGWVKLHRCLMDKPIWINSTVEQKVILITLLMMANHKEKEWEWKGEKYKAKPGQFVTSLKSIAEKSGRGISIKNVRTAIDRFEKYEFLANESTNKNRLITIINWDFYQSQENELASKGASNWQATGKQLATNKNEKNEKNEKNKTLYMEFVFLSDIEHQKLVEKLGATQTQKMIERLNNYIGSKGKKYKSHYHTILNWCNKDGIKPQEVDKPKKENPVEKYLKMYEGR